MACVYPCRDGQDSLLKVKVSIRLGKKGDLSEFERSIPEITDLLRFFHMTISVVYIEGSGKKANICSEHQFSG